MNKRPNRSHYGLHNLTLIETEVESQRESGPLQAHCDLVGSERLKKTMDSMHMDGTIEDDD